MDNAIDIRTEFLGYHAGIQILIVMGNDGHPKIFDINDVSFKGDLSELYIGETFLFKADKYAAKKLGFHKETKIGEIE